MFTGLFCFFFIWILWLVAAFSADSCWLNHRLHSAALEIDRELMRHEDKLITLIQSTNRGSPQFIAAYEACKRTDDISGRHLGFTNIIIDIGQQAFDVDHPIERRYADEYAGALNRRQVAMRHYTEAAIEYNQVTAGLRGSIARFFTELPTELPET